MPLSLKSKVKSFCQRVWSRENVLRVTARIATRISVVIVWSAVMWSLLGNSALPSQYFTDLKGETCFISQGIGNLPSDSEFITSYGLVNRTVLSNTEFSVISVYFDNTTGLYNILQVRRSQKCDSILELQQINQNGTNLSSAEVDIINDIFDMEPPMGLTFIPDGHFFALIFLLIFSSLCGYIAKLIYLPSLFGMIIAGILLRNVPYIDFAKDIQPTWSSTIRNIALVIILIRGGLSMKLKDLKRLKHAVLILGCLPCILEGAIDGIIATFYLRMPWQWGLMLGYIIAAISPAIVVPTALSLQEKGYGSELGELTLIVAAASVDVVISISLFGVFLGLAFSEGSLVLDIFRGPIQIVLGLLYGIIFGLLLWLIPSKHFVSHLFVVLTSLITLLQKKGSKGRNQFFLLFGLGLFALFGSRRAIIGGSNLAASGALAVLVLAFVSGQGWTQSEKKYVSRAFVLVWQLAQPLLFALIGAEINFSSIRPSLVGQGLLLIFIGLIVRSITSFLASLGNKFRWQTMVFIAVSWIPKATVQAAIGPLALEFAIERRNEGEIQLGQQVLTVAVLAILITAPLGAVSISLLGPLLLSKTKDTDSTHPGEDDQSIGQVAQTVDTKELENNSVSNMIKETTV